MASKKRISVSELSKEASLDFGAMAIFATCKERGDIALRDGFKILHAAAQPPYLTGHVARKTEEDLGFEFLPRLREAEELPFEERVAKGFRLALSQDMDGFFGMANLLVALGEKFRQGSGSLKLAQLLLQPKALLRLSKGLIKSKRAKRPMMPQDLWSLKNPRREQ